MTMWILVPISLLFWSSNPVFWSKLSLISQSSEFIPSHFTNVIEHLTQIPFKPGSYGLFSWLSSHLEELLPPLESVTTETPSSDLVNPSPLRQIPESNTEAPFTQDCSLWLLTGAMVMSLDAYFPPLSHPVSFGRPLQAAIPVLHWTAYWWLVPPGWEPDFVSLAPLSYTELLYFQYASLDTILTHNIS
ncbi:hypothetical protein DSO57_1000647 [Entomophthora muscae]|uniref:Uncharacterized protein n=1 Tax=Entomophthora muscae TaxID=34485 RepID=A0ACC2TWM2_9FUNG|nr:hypothetical protein DSO57_1000647 [Entomophthora muscae]